MDPALALAFRRHGGLLLRREALAAGVPSDQIARWLRSGAWTAVRHGVYADTEHWTSLDAYRQQPSLMSRAASLVMTMPHVLSHDSAALEWDLPLLHRRDFMPHITRFGVHGSRTKAGVKHHRAEFGSGQISFVDDFAVLDRARTAVDMAREHGLESGVVACDAALRQGVTRAELKRAVEPMAYWPMVRTVRRAVELADPGAETPGESLMRLMVVGLGVGPVESQFGLSDGSRTYWCDLRVGRHIFEFDGRVKYRSVGSGGLATGSLEQVVWDEKVRSDWLGSFGLGMSRVYWEHLFGPPAEPPSAGCWPTSLGPGPASVTTSLIWRRTSCGSPEAQARPSRGPTARAQPTVLPRQRHVALRCFCLPPRIRAHKTE